MWQKKNSSSLKRSYNTSDGPGGTVEAPIVVEDEGVGGASAKGPTRLEERRRSASDAREIIDEVQLWLVKK